MLTIKKGCINALSCPLGNIKSIAYDGCDYAQLQFNRIEIIRLNEQLCPLGTHKVTRCYTCICFSQQECCYYACVQGYPTRICRLDLNFKKIDEFDVPCEVEGTVCAISMHPSSYELWLLYPDNIVILDVECLSIKKIIPLCIDHSYMDIITLHNGYILSYGCEDIAYIEVICDHEKHQIYEIPCDYRLNAMVLQSNQCSHYEVLLLLASCTTHEQYCMTLQILCNEEEEPFFPPISCYEGKSQIIHSIALEEAGIAHILNAEGEKIQKAVASDATIDDLLLINESVRKTITQITILEGQLYSKLESLHCVCSDEPCKDES